MAKVGRCQSVIVGNKIYYYGDTIPCIKWKLSNGTENEIWNATIIAISDRRENNVSFYGEVNGNLISVSIDMDEIVD